jgi:hypothetical protein
VWHRKLYPIDHGAALYFHHDWPTMEKKIASPFPEIESHVLLPWATEIGHAAKIAHQRLTSEVLAGIVALVPDAWLDAIPGGVTPAERRAGYMEFFTRRLEAGAAFEKEAKSALNRLV